MCLGVCCCAVVGVLCFSGDLLEVVVLALAVVVGTALLGLFHASAVALGDGFVTLCGCVIGVCVDGGSGEDVVESLLMLDAGPWHGRWGSDGIQELSAEAHDSDDSRSAHL